MMARVTILSVLGLSLAACKQDQPCVIDAAITGGCGVELSDDALRIGDDLDAMVGTHGEPSWAELGSAGGQFVYADLGVTGFSRDGLVVDSLRVAEPFGGTTADGLGVGVAILEVSRTLGAGQGSPWVQLNWQLARGLGFEYGDDTITRVHIVPPQDPW